MTSRQRFDDEFVIEQAVGCATYAELANKLRWPVFGSVVAAADRLNLGLDYVRKSSGKPREAQAVPKPVGKGSKPKPKGEGADG